MEKRVRAFYKSPIGEVEVTATAGEICSVGFVRGRRARKPFGSSPALESCLDQLEEYFQGKRRIFELVLRLPGTDFQNRVWRALLDVGYGETASYRDIARAVGRPKAFRAVGNANRSNPISIIIPCHRVVGSSSDLVGYGGGLWRKEWLLDHEKRHAAA